MFAYIVFNSEKNMINPNPICKSQIAILNHPESETIKIILTRLTTEKHSVNPTQSKPRIGSKISNFNSANCTKVLP